MIDYYTVTEYSKRTGKDPGNIRKMLLQGKLVGEKLGNQWIIPKDAVYPDDHRNNPFNIIQNLYHCFTL